MKRGEIWTLRDKHYASKARPVIVIQSDEHSSFDSVILCLFTTYESSSVTTRVFVKASQENGLIKDSFVMTDKIVTVDKSVLGERIGRLSDEEMASVSEQLKVVLALE